MLSSTLATGEGGHALHAYSVNQWVGMTMHQPPFRPFMPKDQGHAQRPVLIRPSADLTVLPFDGHEYRHIARRICLHELQVCLTSPKHLRRGFQCLLGVEATPWFSAVRCHERVVVSMLDQREISANVSSDICGGSVRSASDELSDVPIGDIPLHHAISFRSCRRPGPRQHKAMEPGWRLCVRDMAVGGESAGAVAMRGLTHCEEPATALGRARQHRGVRPARTAPMLSTA